MKHLFIKTKNTNLKLWKKPTNTCRWEMVPGLALKRENQKTLTDGKKETFLINENRRSI